MWRGTHPPFPDSHHIPGVRPDTTEEPSAMTADVNTWRPPCPHSVTRICTADDLFGTSWTEICCTCDTPVASGVGDPPAPARATPATRKARP